MCLSISQWAAQSPPSLAISQNLATVIGYSALVFLLDLSVPGLPPHPSHHFPPSLPSSSFSPSLQIQSDHRYSLGSRPFPLANAARERGRPGTKATYSMQCSFRHLSLDSAMWLQERNYVRNNYTKNLAYFWGELWTIYAYIH